MAGKKAKPSWRRYSQSTGFLRRHAVTILIVVLLAVGAVSFYIAYNNYSSTIVDLPELSTIGYSQVLVDASLDSNGDGVVTLTSGCTQIRTHVEAAQAESIYNGMNGITPARPNAHDIAADAFQSLGIQVLMVKVTDMRNQTFYGRIVLQDGDRVASLDARPSDATAIAVRMNVPVYVKTQLLEDNGENIC